MVTERPRALCRARAGRDNRFLEETTLTIEKLVYGGDGLARTEGRVALVPFVLPGERVRARLASAKGGVLRASGVEMIEPSQARIAPPCPHFTRCGGCCYQHIGYEDQLGYKRAILSEALRRIAKLEYTGEVRVVSASPWGYRNRVRLHIAQGALGYFAGGSNDVEPIASCAIASPRIETALEKLREALPALGRCEASLELFASETDLQIATRDKLPREARALVDSLGVSSAIEYAGLRVARGSFFQVNRYLVDALVAEAVGAASGVAAVDLYAGVGLFAASLVQRFASVTAVEASPSAARDLEFNARRAAAPWRAVRADAAEFLSRLDAAPDFLVADPPRAGLGKAVTAELIRLRPPRLCLVSCDPSTLARDLALLAAGGFRIASMALVDLFPQTFHIETVVHLAA